MKTKLERSTRECNNKMPNSEYECINKWACCECMLMFIAHVVWHFAISFAFSLSLLLRCERPKNLQFKSFGFDQTVPHKSNTIHTFRLLNKYLPIYIGVYFLLFLNLLFGFFYLLLLFSPLLLSMLFVGTVVGWTNIAVSMLHSNYDNSTPFIRLCAHAPSLGTLLFFFFPLRLYTMRD